MQSNDVTKKKYHSVLSHGRRLGPSTPFLLEATASFYSYMYNTINLTFFPSHITTGYEPNLSAVTKLHYPNTLIGFLIQTPRLVLSNTNLFVPASNILISPSTEQYNSKYGSFEMFTSSIASDGETI